MRHIHNTSFIIDESIEKQWVDFMQAHYIDVLKNNNISQDIIFTKVSIDQPEGKTYSVQVVFNKKQHLEDFLQNWLPEIEKQLIDNYRNRYFCFSSILTEL